jgi:surfactin synthase thioesterase subunit
MTNCNDSRWLIRKPGAGAVRARLFCVPYAGVGASAFRLWSAGLPADIEVCTIQLPGRETRLREAPLARMHSIVDALLPELTPHLDLPFAFFGHSMGAVVASELTDALSRRGGPMPFHLFVSGRRAPHLADPDPPLAGLADNEFVAEINRRFGGIPAEILADRELMELLLPCLRADIAALESHQPVHFARTPCPLTVYGGTQDSRAPRAHLEAWRDKAGAAFRVRVFEGNHFFLTPRRVELLADISDTLARSLSAPSCARVAGATS